MSDYEIPKCHHCRSTTLTVSYSQRGSERWYAQIICDDCLAAGPRTAFASNPDDILATEAWRLWKDVEDYT